MEPVETPLLNKPQEVEILIKTASGPIPLIDFYEFLELFRACYAVALESFVSHGASPDNTFDDEVIRQVELTRKHLAQLKAREITQIASRRLSAEPSIITMKRENPTELVLSGLAILFGVAVVISGGKFEVSAKGLKVELKPLGDGLKKLREALKKRV